MCDMKHVSKMGLVLAGVFALGSLYLIVTQGLFGESFVALILGLPWVWGLAYFEFFSPRSELVLGTLLLFPILINVALLYTIGLLIESGLKGMRSKKV